MAASEVDSPSISEFETYLGAREVIQRQYDKQGKGDTVLLQLQRPANMSNEEWWASVLASEQRRLEIDQNSRLVELDDILPDVGSSDDDIAIVGTLKNKNLNQRQKRNAKSYGPTKLLRSLQASLQNIGTRLRLWSAPPRDWRRKS
jgi:hypothetical protein